MNAETGKFAGPITVNVTSTIENETTAAIVLTGSISGPRTGQDRSRQPDHQ